MGSLQHRKEGGPSSWMGSVTLFLWREPGGTRLLQPGGEMALGGNKCSLLVPLYSLLTRCSHFRCGTQRGNERQQVQRKTFLFVRKRCFTLKTAKQLKRQSREAVLSLSLKIFNVQNFQDKALNKFVWAIFLASYHPVVSEWMKTN